MIRSLRRRCSDVHLDRRRRMRPVRWHERQRDRRRREQRERAAPQHRREAPAPPDREREPRARQDPPEPPARRPAPPDTAGSGGTTGTAGATGTAGTTGTRRERRRDAAPPARAAVARAATGSGGARGGTGGAAGAGASSGSGGAGLFTITVQLASAMKSTAPTTVGIVTWSITASGITAAHIDFGLDTTYGMTAPVDLDGDELPDVAARHEAGEDLPLPHRRERRREHVHQRRSDRHDGREAQRRRPSPASR